MYNVELYVEQCIRSILAQKFTEFELIVVDDASPDRSYEIVERLAQSDARIKIIRHERNQGLGAARNTGMLHAQGEYIYFVDSDDLILPHALETLHRAAVESGAEIVHATEFFKRYETKPGEFNTNLALTPDRKVFEGFLTEDRVRRLDDCYVKYYLHPVPWLNLHRRDFLERHNIKFHPNMLSEDEGWSFALYCLADKYYCIPGRFYVYSVRQGAISTTNSSERAIRGVTSILEGCRYLEAIARRFSEDVISTYFRNECLQSFIDRLIQFYVLKYYRRENVTTADATKQFLDALRLQIPIGTERAVELLQGYCLSRLSMYTLIREQNFLRDEIRSGFLVTTERKKLWRVQIELIQEFARVCQKHNLRWFADGGTLLGAARHGGFIPWDDDVDITMLRPDYEVFKRVAPTELRPHYALDMWYDYNFEGMPGDDGLPTVSSDQLKKFPHGWPHHTHAKLRDSRTTMIEFPERRDANQGIWIDIFPFDPMPPFDDPQRDVNFEVARELFFLADYPEVIVDAIARGTRLIIAPDDLKRMLSLTRRQRGLLLEEHLAKNWYESKYVLTLSARILLSRKGFPASAFRDAVQLPFEWITLPAPIDYQDVLTLYYGDWHKIVFSRPHAKITSSDVSYREYFSQSNLNV